jgi:hypothetical protein
MSGSRMVGSNFSGSKTFGITLLADRIPPSYEGSGISISYELLIASQVGGVIDKSRSFPLFFIGPSAEFSLRQAQRNAIFEIECAEVETVPGRLSVECPFKSVVSGDPRDFSVQREGGTVASVRMPEMTRVGMSIVGVISLVNTDSGVSEVKVNLVRRERVGEEIGSTEIGSNRIEMNGAVSRRFAITIPFSTVADFETEIHQVWHEVEFTFYGEGGAWKWTPQITVLPPEISLTKPRIVRS